jgi:hypothetical protein
MIIIYTCTECGIVVRAEGDTPHKACACSAPQTEEVEES